MTLQLRKTAQMICDANGTGTVYVGPSAANESWIVSRISVINNSDITVPRTQSITATVYKNVVGPTTVIGGTYNGTNDTSAGDTISVQSGESLVVQWTNADAGSTSYVYLEGTMELRGVQIYG